MCELTNFSKRGQNYVKPKVLVEIARMFLGGPELASNWLPFRLDLIRKQACPRDRRCGQRPADSRQPKMSSSLLAVVYITAGSSRVQHPWTGNELRAAGDTRAHALGDGPP